MKFKHNQIIDELDFFKPIRTCQYRNCSNDISTMRKSALFCSRNCKSCERKYKKRDKLKKLETAKLIIQAEQMNQMNQINSDVLMLFNKIYS